MIRKTSLYSLFLCLLLAACSGVNPGSSLSVESVQRAKPKEVRAVAPKQTTNSPEALRVQLEQIGQTAQGRVGIAATVLETGESVSINGNEQFPMQSVYKVPIAMAVLHLVDEGKIKLEQRVRVEKSDFVGLRQHSPIRDRYPQGTQLSVSELLRFMVSQSDGSACDVLLKLVGGPQVITDYLRGLNIDGVVVANTEKEIGRDPLVQYRNWASPEGTIVLLRVLHERRALSAQSQALLLKLMTETPLGSRRLKGLLPAGAKVAHKTGTSSIVQGKVPATNDIGIITMPNGRHLAIAVFVSDSKANSAAREQMIAKAAQAAWNYWSK